MDRFAPLTVGRLFDTDDLGRPRLVVLSACETGPHDIDHNPDEFVGQPGAFAALGAAGPANADQRGFAQGRSVGRHVSPSTPAAASFCNARNAVRSRSVLIWMAREVSLSFFLCFFLSLAALLRSWWSQGQGPRGMRASKARAGHRTG
jgi:hypothetical protein